MSINTKVFAAGALSRPQRGTRPTRWLRGPFLFLNHLIFRPLAAGFFFCYPREYEGGDHAGVTAEGRAAASGRFRRRAAEATSHIWSRPEEKAAKCLDKRVSWTAPLSRSAAAAAH